MGSVWKRLNRINKRASKFKFTASYSELWVECGPNWQPSSLSVIWTRKSRRVVSDPLRWEPTMRNPYLGMCVWPVPENKDILVTMFRDPNKEEYDNKDWFFILEDVTSSGKRKPIAQGRLNMRDFSTAVPTQHNLTVKLRPISKKVSSAKLTLTLTSELLKEGKATDEDMRSIASLVSNSTMSGDYGNSLLKGLEEELPEDEAQESVRREISSITQELESLNKKSLSESKEKPSVTVSRPERDESPALVPAMDFSESKIKQVDILPGKDAIHRFKSTYNGPVGDYNSKPGQPEVNPSAEQAVQSPPAPQETAETPEKQLPVPETEKLPEAEELPTQTADKIEKTPAKYSRTKSQEFRDYQHEFMLSSIIDFGPLQAGPDQSRSGQVTSTPISKPSKKKESSPPASPVRRIPAEERPVERPKTPSPPPPAECVVEEGEKPGDNVPVSGPDDSPVQQVVNGAKSSSSPPGHHEKTEITPSKSFLLDLNRNNSVQTEDCSSDSTPVIEKSKPQPDDPKLEKILTDRTNYLLRKNPTKTADDLLDWAKMRLSSYSNVKVTNFTTSWRNGLAFCALLHSFYPDLIPYDALTSHDIKHNCKLAFEAGEKLGIPRVIEPESMAIKRIPDKLAVITYLHQLRSAMGQEETDLLYEKSKEEQKVPGTGVRKSFSEGHISLFSLSATNEAEKSDLATIEENPGSGLDMKPEKVREYQTRAKTLIEKARSESRDSDPEESEDLDNDTSAGHKSSPPKVVMRQGSSSAKSKRDNRISYFDNEMQMLDSEQVEIDKQAAILDKRLRETSEDDQVLYDALLQQWFTLVNKKNALLRRQMQLNILKKEDNLEKKLTMLQEELRNLSEIEENRKTDSDREREELLLQELVLVVNKRNELVMQRDEEERMLHEEEQLDEEITMPENNHLRIAKRDDCKMQ